MRKPIVVIGSYNVGLFLKGRRLPQKGETVVAEFYEGPGGKGSNQAVAAAKLKGQVRYIGCLGDDQYAHDARRLYTELGIDQQYIATDPSIHSGISIILIDDAGDNMISVALGANNRLAPEHIDRALEAIGTAAVLACQLENPLPTIAYALRKAKELGVTTILDPAPAMALPDEVYRNADIMTPNESETQMLAGIVPDTLRNAAQAGRVLLARGVKIAIIKLGERGCLCVTAEGEYYIPAVRVKTVDATGAGDAFAGGLMTALAEGKAIIPALEFASCVGALSVTKVGVVNALPDREQVDRLYREVCPQAELVNCNTCQVRCVEERCPHMPVDK